MTTADREVLRRRFHEVGATVEDAVEAFTCLYPFFGGTGNRCWTGGPV